MSPALGVDVLGDLHFKQHTRPAGGTKGFATVVANGAHGGAACAVGSGFYVAKLGNGLAGLYQVAVLGDHANGIAHSASGFAHALGIVPSACAGGVGTVKANKAVGGNGCGADYGDGIALLVVLVFGELAGGVAAGGVAAAGSAAGTVPAVSDSAAAWLAARAAW